MTQGPETQGTDDPRTRDPRNWWHKDMQRPKELMTQGPETQETDDTRTRDPRNWWPQNQGSKELLTQRPGTQVPGTQRSGSQEPRVLRAFCWCGRNATASTLYYSIFQAQTYICVTVSVHCYTHKKYIHRRWCYFTFANLFSHFLTLYNLRIVYHTCKVTGTPRWQCQRSHLYLGASLSEPHIALAWLHWGPLSFRAYFLTLPNSKATQSFLKFPRETRENFCAFTIAWKRFHYISEVSG